MSKMSSSSASGCIICCQPSSTNTYKSEILDDNFPIIFLLRKLIPLPVSSAFCENLLKENGHPSSWFSFCGSCLILVLKSQVIYSQIFKLQAEFKNLQSLVKTKVLRSFDNLPTSESTFEDAASYGCREKVRRTIGKKCGLMLNLDGSKNAYPHNSAAEQETNGSFLTIKSYGTLYTDAKGTMKIKRHAEVKKNIPEEVPPSLIYYGATSTRKNTRVPQAVDDCKSRTGRPMRKVVARRKHGASKRKTTVKIGRLSSQRSPKKQSSKNSRKAPKGTQNLERLKIANRAETSCPICHIELKLFQLTNHIKKTHEGTEKTIKCKICQRAFYTKYLRRMHIRRVHTGERRYKCSGCQKEFPHFNSLQRHRSECQDFNKELENNVVKDV